jgi:hypothetical protein
MERARPNQNFMPTLNRNHAVKALRVGLIAVGSVLAIGIPHAWRDVDHNDGIPGDGAQRTHSLVGRIGAGEAYVWESGDLLLRFIKGGPS